MKSKKLSILLISFLVIIMIILPKNVLANETVIPDEEIEVILDDENTDIDGVEIITDDQEELGKYIINSVIDSVFGEEYKQILENIAEDEVLSNAILEYKSGITNEQAISLFDEYNSNFLKAGLTQSQIDEIKQYLKDTDIEADDFINAIVIYIEQIQSGVNSDDAATQSFIIMIIEALTYILDCLTKVILYGSIILYFVNSIIFMGLFRKASISMWKAFIPFYRQVLYLKVCKFSPWVYVFAFIPFIGWGIYSIIQLLSYMRLSELYGHGLGVAVCLVIFPHITGLVLAYNKDKYLGDDAKSFSPEKFA